MKKNTMIDDTSWIDFDTDERLADDDCTDERLTDDTFITDTTASQCSVFQSDEQQDPLPTSNFQQQSSRSSTNKKSRSKKRTTKNKDDDRSLASSIKDTAKSSADLAGKAVQTGGSIVTGSFRFTSSLLGSGLRLITQAIIIFTMILIGLRFWKNYRVLGTLHTMISDRNYALCAYIGVAAILLFFEFLAFIRTSTSSNVRDGMHIRRYDTGRGLFSFPILYIGAYYAATSFGQIPVVHPAVIGVQTALQVYGSMHDALLKLCFLGVLSCLARWICSKLRFMMKDVHRNLRSSRSSRED